MGSLGEHGELGVEQMMAKGKLLHLPKAWLKRLRLGVCMCA